MKKTLLGLTPCVLALLLWTTAHADTGDWYVTPAIVYTDDFDNRNIDDVLGGGQFTFGKALTDQFSLEGLLGYSDIPSTRGGSPGQKHLEASVNALAILNRDTAFLPYFLAGVGYLGTEIENGGKENRPTANFGIGFTWVLGNGPVAIRVDYRVRMASESDNNLIDRIASLGVQFYFGNKESQASFDSDGDGVADHWDQCRGTPPGVAVDTQGCGRDSDGDGVVDNVDSCPNTPAGIQVDSVGCPPDSDGDGVADHWDRCPNTVAGAIIDADGCERDSDGDKVVDRLDRCPNTTAGVRVDVNGCEIRDIIRLPGVNFASNSDRLLPGPEQVLADAAATLRKHRDLVVEVAGHTDSEGSVINNQSLSERRANTVRDYMINAGADAANLSARGYGESKPIADNATAQGRATNRRVELRILNR